MSRTNIPITTLTAATAVAEPAGTNLDATNDHYVDVSSCPLEELVIRVSHTTSSSKTLSILAGDNPPADAAGQGNLDTAFADGSGTPVVKYFAGLSSSRFIQNDGTLLIDVPASMTGTITVFRVPRV